MENTEELVEYTIYERVEMIEVRTIRAPKGLTFQQIDDWIEEHGDGDMTDVLGETSQLVHVEGDVR